jgi:hypothetical protein
MFLLILSSIDILSFNSYKKLLDDIQRSEKVMSLLQVRTKNPRLISKTLDHHNMSNYVNSA